MDIDNDDPQVQYLDADWEAGLQRIKPGVTGPGVSTILHVAHGHPASLSLQFTGTGVEVIGFLNNRTNFQDLLTCAVDDGQPVVPQAARYYGPYPPVTFCLITSLQKQQNTLKLTIGSNGVDNVSIYKFHIFTDSPPPTTTSTPTSQAPSTSHAQPAPSLPASAAPSQIEPSQRSRDSIPPSSTAPSLPSSTTSPRQDPPVSTASLSQSRPTLSPLASLHTAFIGSIVGGVAVLAVVISLLLCRRWNRRIRKADPTQISENTVIATPSNIRRLSTSAPLVIEPPSQQGHLTMAPIPAYTPDGPILAHSKPEQFIHAESGTSSSVPATGVYLIPEPPPTVTGSSDSLDTPSPHTRLVHGEVLSTAWCAPAELHSRAQSLLRGFSTQQRGASAMRDVDSGLRVYNEPALPPPYTPD